MDGPPCPYRRSFMALAPCIKRSLWEAGFSRIQSDGELLKEMWELDIEFKQSLTASISLKGSYSIEEACTMLQTLIDKVEPGTPTQGYSSIQREWALRDRIAEDCRPGVPTEGVRRDYYQEMAPLETMPGLRQQTSKHERH